MHVIISDSRKAAYNQALEEVLFQSSGEYLLLWTNRPAVVCGKYQNLFAEVDVPKAQALGVDLIRRISGGGCVYHDLGNLNYSIMGQSSSNEVNYQKYLEPVIKALQALGYPVEAIPNAGIGIGGEKISGSAQRLVKGRALHHGTLLFDCHLDRLRSLANGKRQYYHSKATDSVPWPVTNLKPYDSIETMADFIQGFARELSRNLGAKEGQVSPVDLAKADSLCRDRYESWEWNFAAGPKFSFQRQFPEAVSGIQALAYEAAKGRITRLTLSPDHDLLAGSLLGCPLRPEALAEKLQEHGLKDLAPLFF